MRRQAGRQAGRQGRLVCFLTMESFDTHDIFYSFFFGEQLTRMTVLLTCIYSRFVPHVHACETM
jgi:hypothetical protein